MGILALALALLVNVAAALLLAACLRFRSLASFVLSAYLLGWIQLLAVMYALSPVNRLTRPNLLLALTVLGIGAALTWSWRGKPVPPLAAWRAQLAVLGADPMVRVLGAAIAVTYAYTLALALFTASNDGDPLVYELTRAALWRQQHAVGWLGAAYEPALDVWPAHAEMGTAATMILSGSARFVALGQFASVFALSVAVAGHRCARGPPAPRRSIRRTSRAIRPCRAGAVMDGLHGSRLCFVSCCRGVLLARLEDSRADPVRAGRRSRPRNEVPRPDPSAAGCDPRGGRATHPSARVLRSRRSRRPRLRRDLVRPQRAARARRVTVVSAVRGSSPMPGARSSVRSTGTSPSSSTCPAPAARACSPASVEPGCSCIRSPD